MPKKEMLFPDSDLGGRIQKLRREKSISRITLHKEIFPELALDDNSRSKTVYNWESGKTQPDYDTLKKLCIFLECDSDYLLGLQDTPLKCTSDIMKETGLSENVVENLQRWRNSNRNYPGFCYIVNELLKNDSLIEDALNDVRCYLLLNKPCGDFTEIREIVHADQNRAMEILGNGNYSELAIRFIALKSNLDHNDVSKLYLQSAGESIMQILKGIDFEAREDSDG